MKKFTSLFIVVFFTVCATGQPTITYESNAPQIGDIFYQSYSSDFVNPGPQGPNKTWDFSTLSVYETGEFYAIDPTGTPFADIFTDANIAYNYNGTSTYNYGEINQAEASNLGTGFDETPPMVIYYNNSAKLMEYPFAYSDEFSDNYGGSYEMEGMYVKQDGTLTKTADAWGTITTPAGTYENVLRLKTVREEIDSFWMDELFLWRTVTTFKDYEWYTSNSRSPVFAITITSSAVLTDTISYFSTGMTNIDNFCQQPGNLKVYPNPASKSLNLNYVSLSPGSLTILLIDISGKEIAWWDFEKLSKGIENFSLDISGIQAGLYIIRMSNKNETVSRKVIIR